MTSPHLHDLAVVAGISGRAHAVSAVAAIAGMLALARLVRRRRAVARYSLWWLGAGVTLLVLSAFPGLLDWFSRVIGVAYPPTTLLVTAIGFLALAVAHTTWELSRLEDRTRTLAQELALLKEETARAAAMPEFAVENPSAKDDPDTVPGSSGPDGPQSDW